MSSFLRFDAPADTRYDPVASAALGADHWRILAPFKFYVGDEWSGEWVYVPAGYLTDGASVPRAFWSLIPPWGKYGQAAIVHDIVCEYLSITKDGAPLRVNRAQCDDILLQAMEVLEVPWLTRHAIHKAVMMYRLASGVDAPTTTLTKRRLEAEWGNNAQTA